MILTHELKGLIAKRGLSQCKMAKILGISAKTFYEKMKIGRFNSDEIQRMIQILDIENPLEIFFAKEVTCKDTNRD